MWIFCAGSKRSGSTLQYNIASRIVEIKGKGKRLPHSKPEEFKEVQKNNERDKEIKVFKTHLLTPDIKSFIESSDKEEIKIIYCYRDVRDVNVSLINKGWLNQSLASMINFTKSYLKDYTEWMFFEDSMYKSNYEAFYNDIENEILGISKFLNIELSEEEIRELTNELSVETLKQTKGQYEQKDKFTFDSKTLLHEGHIQGREPKQYKSFFKEREIAAIESVAYDWLTKNDYSLSWIDSNYFLSYSQHADDYIAWQLLGKKNKGVVVEVGAFDGQHLSNSKSLEQIGWTSICLEPSPETFNYLKVNRPRSTNLNMAVVGDESIHEIDFYSEELGVLSGCLVDEEDLKKRYMNRGIEYQTPKKIKVEAKTLNQVLEDQECKKVDVLSIDVEGFELEVLKGLDLNENDINLIIIEANNDSIKNKILDIFKEYKEYMYLGNNYQNLFLIKTSIISKKQIRKLDFSNYVKAKQIHPKGDDYCIDSLPSNFLKSKELLKFEKFLGLF
jgi:FkbM family methyltransferase